MSGKINLTIEGLAICYRKNDAWNVKFLCDKDHPLMFSAIKDNTVIVKESLMNAGNISIEIVNGIKQKNTQIPDFKLVFDLTGEYCHKNGLKLTDDNRAIKQVNMIIPDVNKSNAVFYMTSPTEHPYLVRKVGTNETNLVGFVAKIVGAFIELEPNGYIETKVDGVVLGNKFESGTSFVFDNDCHTERKFARKIDNYKVRDLQEQSDFHLYYSAVSDPDGKTKYEVDVADTPNARWRINCYAVQVSDPSFM